MMIFAFRPEGTVDRIRLPQLPVEKVRSWTEWIENRS